MSLQSYINIVRSSQVLTELKWIKLGLLGGEKSKIEFKEKIQKQGVKTIYDLECNKIMRKEVRKSMNMRI
jgi:hypothetical protein